MYLSDYSSLLQVKFYILFYASKWIQVDLTLTSIILENIHFYGYMHPSLSKLLCDLFQTIYLFIYMIISTVFTHIRQRFECLPFQTGRNECGNACNSYDLNKIKRVLSLRNRFIECNLQNISNRIPFLNIDLISWTDIGNIIFKSIVFYLF